MSQAYYNSPFQQPHDFTAETNLPEYSNPYSLAPEHIPLTTTLHYFSKDCETWVTLMSLAAGGRTAALAPGLPKPSLFNLSLVWDNPQEPERNHIWFLSLET